MSGERATERTDTLVIGGGQAGLAAGWHLARRRRPFLIVDAGARVGDQWRRRWDSLRLFTPAGFDALPGMPFPARARYFPTKDEFADYLEAYAARFDLPVRTGTRIESLTRDDGRFVAEGGGRRIEARRVVVAMSNYQRPWRPAFARDLDPSIRQLHSADYRSPGQLRDGDVLVVGAGNSGAEIAVELARHHRVRMSGRGTGQLPFRPRSAVGRVLGPVVLRGIFYRVLTLDTPLGRAARPKVLSRGTALIRVKARDLRRAGIGRVPRTVGVREGRPVLEDGRVLDVANVVWCTGFRPGFESWIHLPVHPGGSGGGDEGPGDGPRAGEDAFAHEPLHHRGVASGVPGLFFLGLHFQRALSSAMIHGVGRDAGEIVGALDAPRPAGDRSAAGGPGWPDASDSRIAASASEV